MTPHLVEFRTSLHRLHHVVQGQPGDSHRGQRLHLDTGPTGGRHGGGENAPPSSHCSISTAIESMGSGWHSGINSEVRLAAMIPATRADAKASPLGSNPEKSWSRVRRKAEHPRQPQSAP